LINMLRDDYTSSHLFSFCHQNHYPS